MKQPHEYASPQEHMQALEEKLDNVFSEELQACVSQVTITQEDRDSF
tara:strand:+ start:9341 stop:9481 length:141 start_codon:yes stop_codon:yes gene_type:complete